MRLFLSIVVVMLSSACSEARAQYDQSGGPISLDASVAYGTFLWGDYNADGILDYFASGLRFGNSVQGRVYQGRLERSIEGTTLSFLQRGTPINVILSDADWGDFDRDGDLDLVVAGATNFAPPYLPVTQIYRASADGQVALHAELPGVYAGQVTWGDADQDGDLDLFVAGASSGETFEATIFQNDSGSFTPLASFPGLANGSAAWIDVDGDGDEDLVYSGVAPDNRVRTLVIEHTDSGFQQSTSALPPQFFGSIDVADYDLDGDLDLGMNGGEWSPVIVDGMAIILANDGSGDFEVESLLEPGLFYGSLRWFDHDVDGDPDLVASGKLSAFSASATTLYQNDATGFASGPVRLLGATAGLSRVPGRMAGSIAPADYNDDGRVDLVVTGLDDEGISGAAHLNLAAPVNSAPQPPDALTADVNGTTVALRWSYGFDAETSPEGLTYDIRVGTSPGEGDVVSAPADASTGRRQLPRRGRIPGSRLWRLDGLPSGTYFWSVQSVDPSFAGSSFSDEASFTVE